MQELSAVVYTEEKLLKALNLKPLFWAQCPNCTARLPIFGDEKKDGDRIRSHAQNHSDPSEIEHILIAQVFQRIGKQMREKI